jgi:hypothetical protein
MLENANIRESYDITEIRDALEEKLYVPDFRLKPKIINELLLYLRPKLKDPKYKIKPIISFSNGAISGFVICQIDPHYTSYSRKCGTFGWLQADNLGICREMMRKCELFIKKNKVRRLRGPVNFPKSLGGLGIQTTGFQEQMLYGVAFSDSSSPLLEYLQSLGYKKESEYTSVYVAQKTWNKGKEIDENIMFRYFPLEELYDFIDDIGNLADSSLYEIMPDSSGIHRIHEFFNSFSRIPDSFYNINADFEPAHYSTIPHFIEAWESCDLNKIEPYAPMAFDRNTGELVGVLLGLPDLYEKWRGNPITRANVDTAMVKKGYYGRGIFSALNNLGQLTCNLYGVHYFEGTSIWSNNSRAIDTIFPHCTPTRKHYLVQKRI